MHRKRLLDTFKISAITCLRISLYFILVSITQHGSVTNAHELATTNSPRGLALR